MGNAAAAFLGMPEVRFFSAGTTPSALNPRTIAALEAVGFEVIATGEEAPRGPEGDRNPRHLVRWGTGPDQCAEEFSKALGDPSLPAVGFAAVMVCDEADAGCEGLREGEALPRTGAERLEIALEVTLRHGARDVAVVVARQHRVAIGAFEAP